MQVSSGNCQSIHALLPSMDKHKLSSKCNYWKSGQSEQGRQTWESVGHLLRLYDKSLNAMSHFYNVSNP